MALAEIVRSFTVSRSARGLLQSFFLLDLYSSLSHTQSKVPRKYLIRTYGINGACEISKSTQISLFSLPCRMLIRLEYRPMRGDRLSIGTSSVLHNGALHRLHTFCVLSCPQFLMDISSKATKTAIRSGPEKAEGPGQSSRYAN